MGFHSPFSSFCDSTAPTRYVEKGYSMRNPLESASKIELHYFYTTAHAHSQISLNRLSHVDDTKIGWLASTIWFKHGSS